MSNRTRAATILVPRLRRGTPCLAGSAGSGALRERAHASSHVRGAAEPRNPCVPRLCRGTRSARVMKRSPGAGAAEAGVGQAGVGGSVVAGPGHVAQAVGVGAEVRPAALHALGLVVAMRVDAVRRPL